MKPHDCGIRDRGCGSPLIPRHRALDRIEAMPRDIQKRLDH